MLFCLQVNKRNEGEDPSREKLRFMNIHILSESLWDPDVDGNHLLDLLRLGNVKRHEWILSKKSESVDRKVQQLSGKMKRKKVEAQ